MSAIPPDVHEVAPIGVSSTQDEKEPKRRWGSDVLAGLVGAIASVPDGLASAALAGVAPVHGLYSVAVSGLAGNWFLSAQLMLIATTSASALAAGEAIEPYAGTSAATSALFLFVLLIGIFQVIFGLLKLGKLTRFVSHSVMTGFLIGVAAVLVLDQIPTLVGFEGATLGSFGSAIQTILAIPEFDWPTVAIGALSLATLVVLGRTRLAQFSTLLALVLPAVVVAILGMENVQLVADVSPIPRGLPLPSLPDLSLISPSLVTSALAVSIIILVQGAGVGQSFPNRDGSRIDSSRDFLAQGAANLAAGVFQGIPVGGSVGQTALNVSAGARTRWSGIFASVWMLAIVLIVPGLVGFAPMTALSALMIVAGINAINVREMVSIWQTGWGSRLPMLATMLATVFLSIPIAVAVGIVITVVLYLASSSADVRIQQLVRDESGRTHTTEVEPVLQSNKLIVLNVEGSLHFAGARRFEELLPDPRQSNHAAVVLRLRGRPSLGATFIDVIHDYAAALAKVNGRLYLAGLGGEAHAQLRRSRKMSGPNIFVYEAEPYLGAATERAVVDAQAWLAGEG